MEGVLNLFTPFGKVASSFTKSTDKGNIYFLCYGSDDAADREYGPKCAEEAVEKMNGKILTEGDKPIYVSPG
jgi:hypothetical protein